MSASSPVPGKGEQAGPSAVQLAIAEMRALRGRLQASEGRLKAPIAIVGMSCRFPGGADNLDAFWELLAGGEDAVSDVPADRWDIDQWYDPNPDAPTKMSVRQGGFLKDVDKFDAAFFGISDREAVSVDPQHRLLLETSWSAFEDSGFAAETLFGSNTGVFAGISSFDYANLRGQTGDLAQVDAYHATGISHSAAGGRLSYYFGLRGPAISIDTACSSSLVAIHLACQSLRLRECDAALAGGVNLILSPDIHVTLSKARMMAPDGRCKAFDAAADGFVRSEGCGMVVLRRLDDALRDGDRIHAVIRGSACNQDGRSSGLSAPNGPSQTAVIRAAWAAGGLAAQDIDYVEAHGTGTALGDPIEAGALSAALKDTPGDHVLSIGSVKTNLGHMEAAAGVAGVIKTVLALNRERIPASLHYKKGSPNIDWAQSRLRVVAESTLWPRGPKPRLAGVSSFGFSGTNVHLVIEEPPLAPEVVAEPSMTRVVAISAMTKAALARTAEQLGERLVEEPLAPDAWAAFTHGANARRSHFPIRAAFVAGSAQEAEAKLAGIARGEADGALQGRADPMRPPAIGFLAGDSVGDLSDPRADELYATSLDFRDAIDACERRSKANPVSPRAKTDIRAFAVQWSLLQTWRAWSGEPIAITGTGLGTFVAACAADVMSLEDALGLLARRGAYLGEADAMRAAGALAAFREAIANSKFAAPRLKSSENAPIGQDFWLTEISSAKRGAEAKLTFGAASVTVIVDLIRDEAGHRSGASEPGGVMRLACARGPSLRSSMLHAVAALYVGGASIRWKAVEEPRPGRAENLPGYPWSRLAYWFPKAPASSATAAAWPAMIAATDRQADQIPIDLLLHTYQSKYLALEKLASAYIVRTLGDLGALSQPRPILSADALVSKFGVQPLYRELLEIWLNKLSNEGRLERVGADFVASRPLTVGPIEQYDADATAIFADGRELLDYVRGCGALLTKVIKGELSPLETLFPGGRTDLAEGLYHRAALSRYFNSIAAAAAASFAAGRPGPLRVIEVGGGTGGVTGSILGGLPADRSRYTFSDVSSFFFEPAAQRFAAFGFIDFAVLDLEKSPLSQGFELNGYDLVVAANVLHATTDLGQTLDFVRSLLAPGGSLLLYEVTHPPAYFDVSIALIEGWQKSSDDIRGIGPLLNTDKWKDLLPKHGFDLVKAWPETTSPAEVLGSHLFMARASGSVAGAVAPSIDTRTRAQHTFVVSDSLARPELDEICDILSTTPPTEHRLVLVDFVRRRVRTVLKRPESADIAADRRLMDLGLDSLMALELRSALEKGLRLPQPLPATLMFDYPSIAEIAGFLLSQLPGNQVADRQPAPVEEAKAAARPAPAPAPTSRISAAQIEELSDEDVERLLNERLGFVSPAESGGKT